MRVGTVRGSVYAGGIVLAAALAASSAFEGSPGRINGFPALSPLGMARGDRGSFGTSSPGSCRRQRAA